MHLGNIKPGSSERHLVMYVMLFFFIIIIIFLVRKCLLLTVHQNMLIIKEEFIKVDMADGIYNLHG